MPELDGGAGALDEDDELHDAAVFDQDEL
jgi:hypothetical protein